MSLPHPYQWLSFKGQRRVFIVLLILTFAVMAVMNILGKPLITKSAPAGIVSFELAGSLSPAQQMIRSWGQSGRIFVGLNLGLDYLFLVIYASCIALGCVLVLHSLPERWLLFYTCGVWLAWLQFGAAILDAIENYALIRLLLGAEKEIFPAIAWWCAVPKFIIIAAGLLYFVICGGFLLGSKIKKRTLGS